MSTATSNAHDWHCEEHDTYGWRGEACRKCPEGPSEIVHLREQVEKLKAELASIDGALNDPRANLTLTTSEIIWELKEQVEKLTKELKYTSMAASSEAQYANELADANKKLTAERDEWKDSAINGGNAGYLREQLAALAEQNDRLREAINLIYSWANNWDSEFMNDPDWQEKDYPLIQSILSLPDLASPVLNRIRADGVRKASTLVSLVRNDWASAGDNLSVQAAEYLISALDARAAELEKTNA